MTACIHSFYHGCSTFLPVFDQNYDTYDALHDRSPFAVNVICMVAALIRDKGSECSFCFHHVHVSFFTEEPSSTYKSCQNEVHEISQATLFSPVTRLEAIQSMSTAIFFSQRAQLS
jgi:hypothetical protein